MNTPYLEATFRRGKPLAAYLYLPRRCGDTVASSQPVDDLLVVDRATDGRAVGIEILDPIHVTIQQVNALLRQLHQPEMEQSELAPLQVA